MFSIMKNLMSNKQKMKQISLHVVCHIFNITAITGVTKSQAQAQ